MVHNFNRFNWSNYVGSLFVHSVSRKMYWEAILSSPFLLLFGCFFPETGTHGLYIICTLSTVIPLSSTKSKHIRGDIQFKFHLGFDFLLYKYPPKATYTTLTPKASFWQCMIEQKSYCVPQLLAVFALSILNWLALPINIHNIYKDSLICR